MELYRDETEFTDPRMVQQVVDLFGSCPGFQNIIRMGLIADMEYGDEENVTDEDDYVYQRLSDKDSERRVKLLEEIKKEKAEKKRHKKLNRKERRRLEKLKEKQKLTKCEKGKDDSQQSKTEGTKPLNDKSKRDTISSDEYESANQTDSSDCSEDKTSDDDSNTTNDLAHFEELDMNSMFVSKAALIARRKLEQKPETKEKKKAVKVEPQMVPDKLNKDPEDEKKDSAALGTPTAGDNVKISTDFAVIGNRFASVGDFKMAVKYFTDAIKHNPTEFKLFGNRSFCFEKMQEYEKALADAELSLSMLPGWVKGLFRKGRALAGLKRYEEAAQAFREVLKVDGSCAEAAQELMRVQITQLMDYGFTREQSSNALIIHGTVKKAQEVLSKLNQQPGAIHSNSTFPPAQVADGFGVSSAPAASALPAPHAHDLPKPAFKNKPLGPVQNELNVQSRPLKTNRAIRPPHELFPVWVGNLVSPVNESVITNLFSQVGDVSSVKILSFKRCAFVNFTNPEHCYEAISRFHGYELNGMRLAVRFPDRIPKGLGISSSALISEEEGDMSYRRDDFGEQRYTVGSGRPIRAYRQVPNDYKSPHEY
ncbi:ttc31 [Pungitius sinensis]